MTSRTPLLPAPAPPRQYGVDDAVMRAVAEQRGIDLMAPGLQRGLQALESCSAEEIARQVQALDVTVGSVLHDCRLLVRRWLHRGRQRLHRVRHADAEASLRLRHLADAVRQSR